MDRGLAIGDDSFGSDSCPWTSGPFPRGPLCSRTGPRQLGPRGRDPAVGSDPPDDAKARGPGSPGPPLFGRPARKRPALFHLQAHGRGTTLARLVSTGLPLEQRIERLRERIASAARRSGRGPEAVRLVAVVKTVPARVVAEAVAAGIADLGESRVQEAGDHIAEVGRDRARWHLIGHLQRNKAARAAELFDRVHSLDSLELARTLATRAAVRGRQLAVLIEVNISGEATKQGVAPESAAALAAEVAGLPGLALDGLMTVGARVERPEQAREGFARLRELRDRIAAAGGVRLPELSMGMSGDFEAAIAEGSTMVRIGTALFGARA